jgi:hypothetical protein
MAPWIQNTLALTIVAAAAIYLAVSLWRWSASRRHGCGGCHGCGSKNKPAIVLLEMTPPSRTVPKP